MCLTYHTKINRMATMNSNDVVKLNLEAYDSMLVRINTPINI